MGKACPAHTSADFPYILYRHIFPKSLVRNNFFISKLSSKENHFGLGRAYLSCENDCAHERTTIRNRRKWRGNTSRQLFAIQFCCAKLDEFCDTRFQDNRSLVLCTSDCHHDGRTSRN